MKIRLPNAWPGGSHTLPMTVGRYNAGKSDNDIRISHLDV